MYSPVDIQGFFSLFYNGQTGYGTMVPYPVEDGKQPAVYGFKHTPLTIATFARHFSGEQAVGLVPANSLGLCRWGALDVDVYDGNLPRIIVRAIQDFDLPLVPFYSKSGGLHLFLFFNQDTAASDVAAILIRYRLLLGLDSKTEIFPKQTIIRRDGNFLNLPLFGNTQLCAIQTSNVLDHCNLRCLTLEQHNNTFSLLPYADAPPCIQTGLIRRDFGAHSGRNDFLFSVGVYLQHKQIDVEELYEINRTLDEPLDERELDRTIMTGLKSLTYFYKCNSLAFCVKKDCLEREFGSGVKTATGFEYGPIIQYKEDPPYYEWLVQGTVMHFDDEAELMQQTKFINLCVRLLHKAPRRVSNAHWTNIVNKSLAAGAGMEVEGSATGLGSGSQWLRYTQDYFQDRSIFDDPALLSYGHLLKTGNYYLFDVGCYQDYLKNTRNFNETPASIHIKLKSIGCVSTAQGWLVPIDWVPKKQKINVDNIDFHDKEEEGDLF